MKGHSGIFDNIIFRNHHVILIFVKIFILFSPQKIFTPSKLIYCPLCQTLTFFAVRNLSKPTKGTEKQCQQCEKSLRHSVPKLSPVRPFVRPHTNYVEIYAEEQQKQKKKQSFLSKF